MDIPGLIGHIRGKSQVPRTARRRCLVAERASDRNLRSPAAGLINQACLKIRHTFAFNAHSIMLRRFHARSLPSIKQLLHGSSLFPGTLFSFQNSNAPRNRQPFVSGLVRYFGSESPQQGSNTVFHPCADGVFQHGFGSELAVVGFVNDLLGLEGKNAIASAEILCRIRPSENIFSQLGCFPVDLKCSSRDGRHFLVEIQNDFRPRNRTKSAVEQLRLITVMDLLRAKHNFKNKGYSQEFWRDIEGLYTIVISNKASEVEATKTMYPQERISEPFLLNQYEWRHTEYPNRHFGDKHFQMILFNVNNLKKSSATELVSHVEQWAYLFQDSRLRSEIARIPETKTIEGLDFIIDRNPGIKAFVDRICVGAVPSEVLNQYLKHLS